MWDVGYGMCHGARCSMWTALMTLQSRRNMLSDWRCLIDNRVCILSADSTLSLSMSNGIRSRCSVPRHSINWQTLQLVALETARTWPRGRCAAWRCRFRFGNISGSKEPRRWSMRFAVGTEPVFFRIYGGDLALCEQAVHSSSIWCCWTRPRTRCPTNCQEGLRFGNHYFSAKGNMWTSCLHIPLCKIIHFLLTQSHCFHCM